MLEIYRVSSPQEMERLFKEYDPFCGKGLYIMESFEKGAKNDRMPMAEAIECVLG